MSYDPARPRYTLTFAGTTYELVGTFAVIEAVEHALKDGILSVTMRAIEMPASETARLLAAILAACGEKVSAAEVGGKIWEMGIASGDFSLLRLHLHAFLRICISPPAEREEAAKQMGELLGRWAARPASPGANIAASASAS